MIMVLSCLWLEGSIMKRTDRVEFLKELSNLLSKYDAQIEFNCADSSDTHGIFGEGMYITSKKGGILVLQGSWSIDNEDIQQELKTIG